MRHFSPKELLAFSFITKDLMTVQRLFPAVPGSGGGGRLREPVGRRFGAGFGRFLSTETDCKVNFLAVPDAVFES